MARRKQDEVPEGGWIAPGPGTHRTAQDFLDGIGDQTQEEYDAETGKGNPKAWERMFLRPKKKD